MGTERSDHGHVAAADSAPPIGIVMDTVHGRAQVMDILDLPEDGMTVFFRPEHGGVEWTVPISGLPRVLSATEHGPVG